MTFSFSWRSPCAKESTLTAPKKLVAVSASEWGRNSLSSWHIVGGRRWFLIFFFFNHIFGKYGQRKCEIMSENTLFKRQGLLRTMTFMFLFISTYCLSVLCMPRLWTGGLISLIINSYACAPQLINQPSNWQKILNLQLATNTHCTVNNTMPYWVHSI